MKNKKCLGLLGIGCGALLLTGCGGGKSLNCSMNMDDQLAGLGSWSTEIELNYNSDETEVKDATMKMVIEITNEDVTDDMIDSLKESLEDECDTAEGSEYDSCKVKVDGRKITFEATGSAEAMGEDNITEKTTMKEAKELIEGQGWTCK